VKILSDIFLCVVYATLVVAVTLPCKKNGMAFTSAKDAGAVFCALLSACFLPWSGASFLTFTGLGSRWWFAALGGAVVLSKESGTICLACLLVVAATLGEFMEAVGIPGELYDLESLSMIWRLSGPQDLRLLAVGIFFFAGLAFSFAGAGTAGRNSFASRFFSSLAAFSFSGFLLTIFLPIDAALLALEVRPPLLAALPPAVLFSLSIPLSRLLPKLVLPGRSRLIVPPALVLVGCLLLWRAALNP
jgi:hypothetical protein